MTNLPPNEKDPELDHFLEEDEAESLSHALLSLLDAEPGASLGSGKAIKKPSQGKRASRANGDGQASKVGKVNKARKAKKATPASATSGGAPINLTEARRERNLDGLGDVEIDGVRRDLQAALAKPSPTTGRYRVIDVSGRRSVKRKPEGDELRTRAYPKSGETNGASGVVFFDRPTPARVDASQYSVDSPRPTESIAGPGSASSDRNLTRPEALLDAPPDAPDLRLPAGSGGRGGGEARFDNAGSQHGTVAGSSYSGHFGSETTAGSGNRPMGGSWSGPKLGLAERAREGLIRALGGSQSYPRRDAEHGAPGASAYGQSVPVGWRDSEQPPLQSRFYGEDVPVENGREATDVSREYRLRAQRRQAATPNELCSVEQHLGSPFVPSSDLSANQMPQPAKPGIAGLLAPGRSSGNVLSIEDAYDAERSNLGFAALLRDLDHRNNSSTPALMAVAVLTIAVFGWVAYVYIVGGSDAPVDLQRALLAGPLVIRTSAFRELTSRLPGTKNLGNKAPGSEVSLSSTKFPKRTIAPKPFPIAPEIAALSQPGASLGSPVHQRSWARFSVERLAAGGQSPFDGSSGWQSFIVDLPVLKTQAVIPASGAART